MIRSLLPAFLVPVLLTPQARADDNRPLTISIVEETPGVYSTTWKIPVNVPERFLPALQPPPGCHVEEGVQRWSDPLGHWRAEKWRCPQGAAGTSVAIVYPLANPNLATIARLRFADAEEQTVLLQPHQTVLDIPARSENAGIFMNFLRLGVEHIWRGVDHLLFVAGLIFIAGSLRRVLATVTGFTIAHSITLALCALDLVRVPARAVEGVIALSIVFLAVEIVKGPRNTITWRQPIFLAASFGLLHGFGFASVLREVGLPDEGMLAALLAFNLGIEAGQIVFAAAVMLALSGLRRAGQTLRAPAPLQKVSGYGLGVLASYWMIDRSIS